MSRPLPGSADEFTQNNIKTAELPLFSEKSRCTDDTVMPLYLFIRGRASLRADKGQARIKA